MHLPGNPGGSADFVALMGVPSSTASNVEDAWQAKAPPSIIESKVLDI